MYIVDAPAGDQELAGCARKVCCSQLLLISKVALFLPSRVVTVEFCGCPSGGECLPQCALWPSDHSLRTPSFRHSWSRCGLSPCPVQHKDVATHTTFTSLTCASSINVTMSCVSENPILSHRPS